MVHPVSKLVLHLEFLVAIGFPFVRRPSVAHSVADGSIGQIPNIFYLFVDRKWLRVVDIEIWILNRSLRCVKPLLAVSDCKIYRSGLALERHLSPPE